MMAFHHRKILISEPDKNPKFSQKFATDCYLCYVCPENCYLSPPPPQLWPPPPQFSDSDSDSDSDSSKNHVPTVLIMMLCILGVAFLILSYLTLARYRRRRNPRGLEPSRTNYVDENQAPAVVDHPIWYIRTVGLPQSVIEAIASFRYKKADGLIDGNDCAVCLNDFRDGEMVRLLPKCSHAFHLECIDTWLRSHKNCPVCRAPVVQAGDAANVSQVESRPSSSGSSGASPAESSDDINISKNVRISRDLQPVRRSVSMDLSCASNSSIYRVMKRSFSFSGKRSLRKNCSSSSQESFQIDDLQDQGR